MAILRGSRFQGVAYTGIKTDDGCSRKVLALRRHFTAQDISDRAIEHVVEGEEQLDTLAERYYRDERLWWLIADVNEILFPLDIPVGTVLIVPDPAVLADLGLV